MSVVQFSADSWQASSPGLMKGLGTRVEALSELAQGLESLAGSGQISGVGADAMRAYIREVHVPLVQSLLVGLFTFQTAIGKYWDGYSQVDTDGNFRLVNDEFDAHLTQLEEGVGRLQGFASDLRSISASAAHVVALSGAGAGAVDRAVEQFERMRLIAKVQQETWDAYESSDPGFVQVQQLIAEVNTIVANVGTLTVGQGRTYISGSFDLALGVLGSLTSGMVEYCQTNQEVAAAGWENLFSGYSDDVEAEAERQRREDAQWGMLWDGLQILGGAVVTVIGLGLTPFTAGASLGLTVLGASLVVGGVNNMINHASIATTGNELNFIGMATDQIAGWYDVNVAQPAMASGSPALQLLAGVGSGVGQVVSDAAQLNVAEVVTGVSALVFDQNARDQMWEQVTGAGAKVLSGDFYLAGQIVGNLIPLGAAAKLSKINLLGKVDNLFTPNKLPSTSGGTSALDFAKELAGTTGAIVRSILDDVKHALSDMYNGMVDGLDTIKQFFTPSTRALDEVTDRVADVQRRYPDVSAKNAERIANYERLIDSGRYKPYVVRFFEGSIFNLQNAHRYTANEVYLDVGGKHNAVRLDSYTPGDAVVSRKNTQLAEQPRGALAALNEIKQKYNANDPGVVIADTPGNRANFPPDQIGKPLDGPMLLEVPVQNAPIPDNVLQLADKLGIDIVDVEGNKYN